MEKKDLNIFKLGLEELSLAMAMINRAEMGRVLLQEVYPKISETEIESRLTSASHSMLARELCTVSNKGVPILAENLEKALHPFLIFDYFIQVLRVQKPGGNESTIHVQKNRQFTSHDVKDGVIHTLSHGKFTYLSTYLSAFFTGIGEYGQSTTEKGQVNNVFLNNSQKMDRVEIENELKNFGWNKTDAQNLAEDFTTQILRGTILRVDSDSKNEIDMNKVAKQSVLLLRGKKRSWLFKLELNSVSVPARAFLVDGNGFSQTLSELIS